MIKVNFIYKHAIAGFDIHVEVDKDVLRLWAQAPNSFPLFINNQRFVIATETAPELHLNWNTKQIIPVYRIKPA